MTSKLLACDQLEMLNASKCVMPTWLVKWISWGLTPQQMDVRYYTFYWQLATIMIPLLRVNNDKQLKPLNVDVVGFGHAGKLEAQVTDGLKK